MNPRVYVARKDCGCIVAAFPVNMDKAIKGKLLEQFSKAGYDIEQTTQGDVRLNYHITCDHNRPPLLAMMDERTAEGRMAIAFGEGITTSEAVETGEVSSSSPSQFSPENGEGGEGPVLESDGQPLEEEHSFEEDEEEEAEGEGADQADVDALAGDISPEAEEADELLAQDEF